LILKDQVDQHLLDFLEDLAILGFLVYQYLLPDPLIPPALMVLCFQLFLQDQCYLLVLSVHCYLTDPCLLKDLGVLQTLLDQAALGTQVVRTDQGDQ